MRNVPAVIAAPKLGEEEPKTRGLLAAHANDALRQKEQDAFAEAVKDKHEHPSNARVSSGRS